VNDVSNKRAEMSLGFLPPWCASKKHNSLHSVQRISDIAQHVCIVFRVSNYFAGTVSANYTVRIIAPPSVVTSGVLLVGQVGMLYSASLSQSGGLAPHCVYGVQGGTLPPGLALNGSSITGSPFVAGNFTIVFTVQAGFLASSHFEPTGAIVAAAPLTVSVSQMLNVIFPLASSSTHVGTEFQTAVLATGGSGSLVYFIANGSVSLGLSLNSASGVISGSPSVSGTFPLTFDVRDQLGARSTVFGVISVSSPPLSTGAMVDIVIGALNAVVLAIGCTIKIYRWYNCSPINLKDDLKADFASSEYYKF
jgi:hypothetical protein